MKRSINIIALGLIVCMSLGTRLVAQHGHGMGGGMSHNMISHGPTPGVKAGGQSATERLTANSKLDSKLTSKLQAKGLLPQGLDLKDACSGFKNLGQCVAAIHVSHNLRVNFFCMRDAMTAVAPPEGTSCTTSAHMSLGKAIQTLRPTTDAKLEVKKGNKEAAQDLKDSEAGS